MKITFLKVYLEGSASRQSKPSNENLDRDTETERKRQADRQTVRKKLREKETEL